MFSKILIANRGEIACRIIRACQEMRIKTVAVYSTADAQSLHVKIADEAVCIGPPPNKESYLNAPNIIEAAHITGAEAVHPGYGYLSEQSIFAEACEMCNLVFIGPPPSVIDRMGDKAKARETAKASGVPIIPGTEETVASEAEAQRTAAKIGFPVYIKAVAGGGGTGIRRVDDSEELPNALKMAKSESEAAFGNPEVYIEKLIEEPRHIEAQILADNHGTVIHLGVRECSVQNKRHKKLVEEAPASEIPQSLRNKIAESAVKLAKSVGYRGAGTVEYPVTEAVTGVDIVKQQIRVAAGERLGISQRSIEFIGHSIECRITAEDPARNYAPSAGTIESIHFPAGLGVRVESHAYSGYEIPPYYDPMIAKIIVWAPDRPQAIARMQRCLNEMEVIGVPTNLDLQKRILANAHYRKGDISTDFVHRRLMSDSK
ncbi:MAG: biotin carboxylase N-terminal domain-containing protein [Chthonomonadales bacterium]